ncbi:hypothetical protein CC86DRAFT_409727 [Ophiobolus disseminans]|uniref:Uncharacterized protein n=1 Tax=Ophiobolus disseminans TaxID=1469910 RepID=A0A6A6ZPE1_9PLEO|nr:hypothetical protein CC86DRAFT_409727 [Ophiobolus disseminans]
MAEDFTDRKHSNVDTIRKPTWLDTIFNVDIEASMKSGLFQTVQTWIKNETGMKLSSLGWAITFLIPAKRYGCNTIDWLRNHFTNTTHIDMRTTEAVNLDIWASKQPVPRSCRGCLPPRL